METHNWVIITETNAVQNVIKLKCIIKPLNYEYLTSN